MAVYLAPRPRWVLSQHRSQVVAAALLLLVAIPFKGWLFYHMGDRHEPFSDGR